MEDSSSNDNADGNDNVKRVIDSGNDILIPSQNNTEKGTGAEALEQVKLLLGRIIRILISDGRLIEGEFQCMDKDLNFILGGAVEYYGLKDQGIVCCALDIFRL
jgi:small nuclear ribonucleoprotein (snRNP)-like protein